MFFNIHYWMIKLTYHELLDIITFDNLLDTPKQKYIELYNDLVFYLPKIDISAHKMNGIYRNNNILYFKILNMIHISNYVYNILYDKHDINRNLLFEYIELIYPDYAVMKDIQAEVLALRIDHEKIHI